MMKRNKQLSWATLLVGNATISLALTATVFGIEALVPASGLLGFLMVCAVFISVSVILSAVILHFNREQAKAAKETLQLRNTAIDMREKALTEHTLVSVTSLDGKLLSVNKNFLEAFGYGEEEVIGKSTGILYGDNEPEFKTIRDTVTSGNVWRGMQDLVSKSGKTLRMQTTILPRFDQNGRLSGNLSVRTDLTSAMAQGAASARDAVAEALPDEIYIYDPKTFELHYANAAARRRFDLGSEDVAGTSVNDLINETEAAQFRSHLQPLVTDEVALTRSEMEHRLGPMEVVTHKALSTTGTTQFVSVVRDISERKLAEQMKLSSVSTVSHELRTPLTSIRGALRLLESGVAGDLDAEAMKLVTMANRNSERLLAIVNDILTLQKLSSGEMTMVKRVMDLRDLVSDAVEANALFAQECGVRLVISGHGAPATIEGDSDRLMQVMVNLISNAAKFSPSGSRVGLSIEDRDTGWRVAVEDQGPGIPEEARNTIFNSFTQVEATKSTQHPGTGLGLTICKEIIRQHDGTIGFDTKIGGGTVFHFELAKATNAMREPGSAQVA